MARSLWLVFVLCCGVAIGAKPDVLYTWNMLTEEGLAGVSPIEQENAVLLAVKTNLSDEATQVTLQSLFSAKFESHCLSSTSTADCLPYISAVPGQVCGHEMAFLLSYPVRNTVYYALLVHYVCQDQATYVPAHVLLDFFRSGASLHPDLKVTDARALRSAFPSQAAAQVAATVAQSHHVLLQISNQLSEAVQPVIQDQFNALFASSCDAKAANSQCQFYLPPPNQLCHYVVDMSLLEHYKSGAAELYLTSADLVCESSHLQIPASVLVEYFGKTGKLHQTFTIIKIHEVPPGINPVILPGRTRATKKASTNAATTSQTTAKPKSLLEKYWYTVVLSVTSELSTQNVQQILQANFNQQFGQFCNSSGIICSAYLNWIKACTSRLHIDQSFMYHDQRHLLVSADFQCSEEVRNIPASVLVEYFNQAANAHVGLTIDSAFTLNIAKLYAAASNLAREPNARAESTALMMSMTRLQLDSIKALLETYTIEQLPEYCSTSQHAFCQKLAGYGNCRANVTLGDSYLMQQTKLFSIAVQLFCDAATLDIPASTLVSFFNLSFTIDPNFVIIGIYFMPDAVSTTPIATASFNTSNSSHPATAYVTGSVHSKASSTAIPQTPTNVHSNASAGQKSTSNSAVTSGVTGGNTKLTSSAANASPSKTSAATKSPAHTSGVATGNSAVTTGATGGNQGVTSSAATRSPIATSSAAGGNPGSTSNAAIGNTGSTSNAAIGNTGSTSNAAIGNTGSTSNAANGNTASTSSPNSANTGSTSNAAIGNTGSTSNAAIGNTASTSNAANGNTASTSSPNSGNPAVTSSVAGRNPGVTTEIFSHIPDETSLDASGNFPTEAPSTTSDAAKAGGVTSGATGAFVSSSDSAASSAATGAGHMTTAASHSDALASASTSNDASATKSAAQSKSTGANAGATKDPSVSNSAPTHSESTLAPSVNGSGGLKDYLLLLINSTLQEMEIEKRLESDFAPLFRGFCEHDEDEDDDEDEEDKKEHLFCGKYIRGMFPRLRSKRQVRLPQCEFKLVTVNVSHLSADLTQLIGYFVLTCGGNVTEVVPSHLASHVFAQNRNQFAQMHIASASTVAAIGTATTAIAAVTTNANELQTNVVYLTTVVYDNTYFIATICLGVISSILLIVILTYLGHYCMVGRYEREALVQLLRSVTTRRHYGTIDSPGSPNDGRDGRNSENAKIFQY